MLPSVARWVGNIALESYSGKCCQEYNECGSKSINKAKTKWKRMEFNRGKNGLKLLFVPERLVTDFLVKEFVKRSYSFCSCLVQS